MLHDFHSRDAGTLPRQAGSIYGLLGELLKDKPSSTREDTISKAIGIMEETYSESITVEALAETLGLDRSYFSSLFKKKTGCTPHGYLIALRIRKARFLLLNTDHSIAEISELVGLDPRNFARLFRKETGETPLSYRNTRRQSERGAFMLSSL